MSATKSLRVALVQTQAENAGAQEISRLLSSGLEARGHLVRQVFFFRRTASFDTVGNAVFCCSERPSGLLGRLRFLLSLGAELKRHKPDVVVTFQHYGNVIAAPVARLLGVKAVVANQVTAMIAMPRLVKAADKAIGLIGIYDRIVVNSKDTEADYAGYPAAYRRRLVRIDHGFRDKTNSIPKAEARSSLGLPASVPLLGCAARLHPSKRLDAAIRVLAINPGQHLALAGQGAERPRLEALADALGVRDRVHFLGELPPDRIGVFLAALDCFVFPSSSESFGLAPVEAAQAGVPVVANSLPVLEEVLAVDGEPCALFVNAADVAAFASAGRRVCEERYRAGARSARGRRLAGRYPLAAMIDHHISLIESLAEQKQCESKSGSTALLSGAGTVTSKPD